MPSWPASRMCASQTTPLTLNAIRFWLALLAPAYRCVYNVVGGYVAANLAPRNPMRHAVILGGIGTALGLVGAIATIPMHVGPAWYPLSLLVTALPLIWLGGALYRARNSEPITDCQDRL